MNNQATRWWFFKTLGMFGGVLLAASAGVVAAGADRPNIVLFLVDDKCYDAHRESPNMAR